MQTPDLSRRPLAVALVASPLLALAAEAVSPPLKAAAAEQLRVIAAQPDRWFAYTLLLTLSIVLLVPATLAVMRVVRASSPRLAFVGGVLLGYGAIIGTGDSMSQLVTWQMASPAADPGQMAALQDRFDNAGGAALFFGPGGLAFLVGTVALAVALVRCPSVGRWVGIAFAVGNLGQLAGFTVSSVWVIAVGAAVELIALVPVARSLWREDTEALHDGPSRQEFVPAI
jgi:hypothetical protein